jgi:hypothetical protein
MNTKNPNIITYSNHFYFEGVRLAFRKKELFNISETPKYIPYNEDGFWIVNRKQLTKLKAKELIINKPIYVDVSDLSWHIQCHLEEVFNL